MSTQPCPLSSLPALSHKLHPPRREPAALPTQLPPGPQSRAWTRHLHSCLHLLLSAHPQNPPCTCTHHDQGPPLSSCCWGLSSGGSHSSASPRARGSQHPDLLPPERSRRLSLRAAIPQGLVLGPGPSPQERPQGCNDHSQSGALSPHGLPVPLASRPNLAAAPDETHPPGDPHVPSSKPAP